MMDLLETRAAVKTRTCDGFPGRAGVVAHRQIVQSFGCRTALERIEGPCPGRLTQDTKTHARG